MAESCNRPSEVLAFTSDPRSLTQLESELQVAGWNIDVVADLAEVRSCFFHSGGHRVLILGPGLTPKQATTAANSLRGIDPDLTVIAFGAQVGRPVLPTGTTLLTAFHPASRAGIGAILRVLAYSHADLRA